MPECSEPPNPPIAASPLRQDQRRFMTEVAARATVFLGHGRTQGSHWPRFLPSLTIHHALRTPGFVLGAPLLFEESGGRLVQHLVFVGHPGGVKH